MTGPAPNYSEIRRVYGNMEQAGKAATVTTNELPATGPADQ